MTAIDTRVSGLLAGAAMIGLLGLGGTSAALAEPAVFESPDSAVGALIEALEAEDVAALVAVFGPENEDVALTGDEAEDRETWGDFLSNWRTLNRIETGEDAAILMIGRDLWPFPAPLVRTEAGWQFDAAAAREEVRLRRIGENELDVIDLMRGYVRAQRAYRVEDPDGDGLPTFARAILSSAGARDGLYWPDEPDAPVSPIGDFMARAAADGFAVGDEDVAPEPYLGYYYRVLDRQGAAAPGGAMNYVVNGQMVAGHALLAFPAAYDETGIMSFMVGEAGVVYEADLGEETLAVGDAIVSFDPGEGWEPVE